MFISNQYILKTRIPLQGIIHQNVAYTSVVLVFVQSQENLRKFTLILNFTSCVSKTLQKSISKRPG